MKFKYGKLVEIFIEFSSFSSLLESKPKTDMNQYYQSVLENLESKYGASLESFWTDRYWDTVRNAIRQYGDYGYPVEHSPKYFKKIDHSETTQYGGRVMAHGVILAAAKYTKGLSSMDATTVLVLAMKTEPKEVPMKKDFKGSI